jgi:hypothetical protein
MSQGAFRSEAENPGQPIRQPAVALLTIDTADRINPETSLVNNIYINKQQTLMDGFFTRIALTEINYTWDIPNVNARNNTLTVTGNYGTITATLPEGYYTPTELAILLESSLEAAATAANPGTPADNIFTVTYTDGNRTFFIENNNNPFYIETKPNGADLTYIMGLANTIDYQEANISYTGAFAPMIYTPYFDIISQQLTKKQNVKDNSTSVNTGQSLLARIYLTPEGLVKATPADETDIVGCRPFTIHREFQNPKQIYWDTKEFINVVDLRLVDKWGNLLYETGNTEVQVGSSTPAVYDVTLGSGYTNFQLSLQITET